MVWLTYSPPPAMQPWSAHSALQPQLVVEVGVTAMVAWYSSNPRFPGLADRHFSVAVELCGPSSQSRHSPYKHPRCHFPRKSVRYPRRLACCATVGVVAGKGCCSFAPKMQSRKGVLPLSSAARVGEQTGLPE